jgi:hypothetical protein
MINWNRMLQIALVGGIVYLAANRLEGWGWLVFILFISLDHER